jgi:hypothetical protein
LRTLFLMDEGWRERAGDLLALLRCTVAGSGMNPPRGGLSHERMHPWPSIAVKRRRKLLAESGADNWHLLDAAMDKYTKKG